MWPVGQTRQLLPGFITSRCSAPGKQRFQMLVTMPTLGFFGHRATDITCFPVATCNVFVGSLKAV